MEKADLARLTLIDLLEQALEQSAAEKSAAELHIRKATDSVISEIKDEGLRKLFSSEN